MVDRRHVICLMSAGLVCLPLRAGADAARGMRRIGYLDQGSAIRDKPYTSALRQGLRDLGWIEDRNLTIVERFAEGTTSRLPALAAELVGANVEAIVTWGTPAALAAKAATSAIPIVIGFAADPVASGIVPNLTHPGGNVTGWTHIGLELRAKYLELLKEAVPDAVRFGVLWNPANPIHKPSLAVIERAAQRLGVDVVLAPVQDAAELEGAFTMLAAERVQALIVFPDGLFIAQMPALLALAARYRLPALYGVREYVDAGGFVFYGADLVAMQRRVGAAIVDKVLKGAQPGDIPVEQPTEFQLVVNARTARALGVTVPRSFLLRANAVIR